MLRVSYSDTAAGQRWYLYGRLAGPWVEDLRLFWRQVRERAPRAPAVVELEEVTFIDEAGVELLREMQCAGAQFIAGGVENKHLLESLSGNGERALRRRVADLGAPCAELTVNQEGKTEK